MGRTKPDSIELDPRPEASHVARTDQDDVRAHLPPEHGVRHGQPTTARCSWASAPSSDRWQRCSHSMAGIDGHARRPDQATPGH